MSTLCKTLVSYFSTGVGKKIVKSCADTAKGTQPRITCIKYPFMDDLCYHRLDIISCGLFPCSSAVKSS